MYRLGESIIGIIKFKTNALRCYQVTTYLETHEQIEYPYALRSKGKGGRVTKKVIAQQQDFCLNNSKIFVELPIPLYATPEFNINAGKINLYKSIYIYILLLLLFFYMLLLLYIYL